MNIFALNYHVNVYLNHYQVNVTGYTERKVIRLCAWMYDGLQVRFIFKFKSDATILKYAQVEQWTCIGKISPCTS